MTAKKPRYNMKENRIPIGKKRENLEKIGDVIKNQKLEVVFNQGVKKKASKTNQNNQSKALKVSNLNSVPTDTSLMKPAEKLRAKLSTIKEIKELEEKACYINTQLNNGPSSNNLKQSTVLVRNVQGENCVEDLDNTMDQLVPRPPIPEVIISPYVCMTRGQKWKPTPVKPPKLSELYNKYEVDNVADTYRKKLDEKTIELHGKIVYWTNISSENGSNIPESVKDEIDVVCGQTKLLTTDKFMQMRSLIEEFDNNSGTMPINTDDLDGFWDMLLLQVKKVEGQFNELAILKNNKWVPIQPVAKQIINRVSKVKRPVGSSTFTNFLKSKNKKPNDKNINNFETKDKDSNHSKFYEMKSSNNTCLISSTPTSSNKKPVRFTPMLLKTMELSYVARRSGMTPLVLGNQQASPLKPALKDPVSQKPLKRKNIQFKTPETTPNNGFITPKNSYNDHNVSHKKSVQNRVVTPHTAKLSKLNRKELAAKTKKNTVETTNKVGNHTDIEKTKPNEKISATVKSAMVEHVDSTVRRSKRLAKKPTKNYKC